MDIDDNTPITLQHIGFCIKGDIWQLGKEQPVVTLQPWVTEQTIMSFAIDEYKEFFKQYIVDNPVIVQIDRVSMDIFQLYEGDFKTYRQNQTFRF